MCHAGFIHEAAADALRGPGEDRVSRANEALMSRSLLELLQVLSHLSSDASFQSLRYSCVVQLRFSLGFPGHQIVSTPRPSKQHHPFDMVLLDWRLGAASGEV